MARRLPKQSSPEAGCHMQRVEIRRSICSRCYISRMALREPDTASAVSTRCSWHVDGRVRERSMASAQPGDVPSGARAIPESCANGLRSSTRDSNPWVQKLLTFQSIFRQEIS